MAEKLFSDFEPISKETWKEKVITDLKGADFDKKLVWKTENGMTIPPYFNSEDRENKSEILSELKNILPSNENEGMDWKSFQRVVGKDNAEVNTNALYLLDRGVEGLVFDVDSIQDFDIEQALKGISIEMISIGFENVKHPRTLMRDYVGYLHIHGVSLDKVAGYINFDPIHDFTTTGAMDEEGFQRLSRLISYTAEMPNFKVISVASDAFVNAGANHVQELAFSLNTLVEYIDQLSKFDVEPTEVLSNVIFQATVGGDYFHEIAKFRAFRLLVLEIAKLYDASFDASNIVIVGNSSLWSKSLYDPNVNMLRNTTEAMSAVLGGVDAINIEAHNASYEKPTTQSQRVALNISHLMREEAYLGKVADPASGSYYIDTLTEKLLDAALLLFQTIESEDGFLASFKSGGIQSLIQKTRDQKEKLIAQRRSVYVGTNRYPNQQEVVNPEGVSVNHDTVAEVELLLPQRATLQFENLRLKTEKYVHDGGTRPKVFNTLFGNLAMRKARSTFAMDFFGTAGFISEEQFFDSVEEAIQGAIQTDADIVVMCSSDPEYQEHVAAFAKAFKASEAKGKKLILAGFPGEFEAAYTEAGVDGFVHVKTNAIQALSQFQADLEIA
ncbi:methylmalonyl-CoA mutase family protein [Flammeovirga sp. OC4]|uniref:methylmalonyl-CoA mutase family protein n=1 Tax=Flammeovirga sp. OC4 TaxID=1382345 RepID=UPI0005C4908C|nr:methylmalonyl-CoA mutase family protein [Flammeovirga sp. OC4]